MNPSVLRAALDSGQTSALLGWIAAWPRLKPRILKVYGQHVLHYSSYMNRGTTTLEQCKLYNTGHGVFWQSTRCTAGSSCYSCKSTTPATLFAELVILWGLGQVDIENVQTMSPAAATWKWRSRIFAASGRTG